MATGTGTKFVWASVARGNKQTIAEFDKRAADIAQAAADRAQAAADMAQAAAEQKRIAADMAQEAAAEQKRIAAAEQKRIAADRAQAAHMAIEAENKIWFTREMGYFNNKTVKYYFGHYGYINVPKDVSERAMKFMEVLLVNYPEWQTTCLTVDDLEKAFYEAYVPYVVRQYNGARGTSLMLDQMDMDNTAQERYHNIQAWALKMKQKCKEPWLMPVYIFLTNVTWPKCLWAINEASKTFESVAETETETVAVADIKTIGIIRVEADQKKITWLVDIPHMLFIPHNKKESCKRLDWDY